MTHPHELVILRPSAGGSRSCFRVEYRRFRVAARGRGVTLSQWAREALRSYVRSQPEGDAGRKLMAVRAAARHEFPTADVEQMLAEIERGYLG
jgi:hypothetical protein